MKTKRPIELKKMVARHHHPQIGKKCSETQKDFAEAEEGKNWPRLFLQTKLQSFELWNTSAIAGNESFHPLWLFREPYPLMPIGCVYSPLHVAFRGRAASLKFDKSWLKTLVVCESVFSLSPFSESSTLSLALPLYAAASSVRSSLTFSFWQIASARKWSAVEQCFGVLIASDAKYPKE